MSIMCAYQNCLCVKYPCGSTAFFRLPTDSRRSTWIKNSGNKSLLNISDKAQRFFCENHFRKCDIRTQFNRKLLRKHAVPIESEASRVTIKSDTKLGWSNNDTFRQAKTAHPIRWKEKNNLVEELGSESSTKEFYEDTQMQISEIESHCNETIDREDVDRSYTLLDFYLPTEDCETFDQPEDGSSKVEKSQTDFAEIYYEETDDNQVDSSTIEIHSNESVELAIEPQPEVPISTISNFDKPRLIDPATSENAQVTILNNDYQEDKHFALSLVGYFQRLPKEKKSLAKLKILQYLTELDIGYTENL